MGGLSPEVDPAEVGLDSARLARIDRHFSRYVDDGRLPGWLLTVSRHGKLAHVGLYGHRDTEADRAVSTDTIWRIYSMSKPVTSVAAMLLYEEGAFELTDPVSKFIPSFAGVRVFTAGSDIRAVTVPAVEPVRIWHLLTHTGGLTYGFHRSHPVDAMYRGQGFEWGTPRGADLAACCDLWAEMPLLFQPGSEWNYSVATDVLGRVVEVASGMSLDEFFAERIFAPLGMTETGFSIDEDDRDRLAALYTLDALGPGRKAIRLDSLGAVAGHKPTFLGGGGGLVSTAADYHRFTSMLLGTADSPAGELDGVRLLSPRTVAYMTTNHLPGGADLAEFGRPLFAEAPFDGVGFGLGFAVVIDPVPGRTVGSVGEYSWGGAASTAFFVDQATGVTASFFTQLLPSSAHPIRSQLRQLVYQALID
ncbi:MAG TPA: serine hydrolase domain-containing protein [Streptosporangiaceae bacterium]|nr:serine hydrolase domain-containing protein [Streptosporangiaceae bacterium]